MIGPFFSDSQSFSICCWGVSLWTPGISQEANVAVAVAVPCRVRRPQQSPNGRHQCPRCLKVYTQSCNLTRHMNYACGIEPRFSCLLCFRKFKRKEYLVDHLKALHYITDEWKQFISEIWINLYFNLTHTNK